jgi:hypothetical protein
MLVTRAAIGLVTIALGMCMASLSHAKSQSITASIRFIAPVTLAAVVDPSLGDYAAGAMGRNFVLGTDGSISGTDAAAYVGGASVGSIKIQGSEFQNIDIVARNLLADGGVSITRVSCDYGGTGSTDCVSGIASAAPPTHAGTTLLLGLSVTTTAAHSDGSSAAPTFDIIISYN